MVSAAPLELLEQAAQQTSPEALQHFVFSNPILMKPDIRADLGKTVEAAPIDPGERERLLALLEILRMYREAVTAEPAKYYVGIGPLEVLAQRVAKSEISMETAEKLAAEPAVTMALSGPYLIRLSAYCRGGVQVGKWREVMPQVRILRAAAAALPPTDEWEKVQEQLDMDWIEIVHGALIDVPDGRWLTGAIAAGNRVIARAKASRDDALLAEVSHLLGTMYLDPYTARFTSANYQSQIDQWLWRLRDELGKAFTWIPPAELKMPEPAAALNLAISHLKVAVQLRKPELRPFSAKALDQAVMWLKIAGGTVDPEAAALAERAGLTALAQIDRQANPDVWVAMFAQRASREKMLDFAPLDELLKTPSDDFVERIGGLRTARLMSQAVPALANRDPVRGLELFRLALPVMARYADAKSLSNWHEIELSVILRGIAAPRPEISGKDISLEQMAAAQRAAAAAHSWGATKLAASLVLLAAASGNSSEEVAGLGLLDEAEKLAPVFAENHAGALGRLRAMLLMGEGVNGYQRGDWAGAITHYGQSLAGFLLLRLNDMAMESLRRINDVTAKPRAPITLELAAAVMPLALQIEAKLGDPGRDLVLAACKHAVATAAEGRSDVNVTSLLWQVAKGLRFSAALTKGLSRLADDGESDSLLAQIAAFPASLRAGGAEVNTLNEAVLLSPYLRGEAAGGVDDEARLANLQQQYDHEVTNRLLTGPVLDAPPYAEIATIQASLDERTVLVCYFLGENSANQPAIYLLAITREARYLAGVTWTAQGQSGRFAVDGVELDVSPITSSVYALREHIQDYAGPDEPLSEEAARRLDGGLLGYFGNLPEYLAKLREEGKDHLCIVPHGALHYLPLHAIREHGRPLAETWVITYLPNMGLLFGYRGGATIPPARKSEMTSIGLTFQTKNPFNLTPMPQSGSEAGAVAALFNTKPVLDEAATETAVIQALQHSHYVHLSTHGRHNTSAPSFQSLFFTPGETSDGMLHAFEILSLDLRGIDILTLSACETALGRFDQGDNLRGLPASFLLAGVSTLIGTLWEVDAAASETFFVAFYTQIKSGANRRDAFWQAQRETRAAFPRYAHWAAFYFIGSWR